MKSSIQVKRQGTLFFVFVLTLTLTVPFEGVTTPAHFEIPWYLLHSGTKLPLNFENYNYTLHAVDGQGRYYYVEKLRELHRFCPETDRWEMTLFKSVFPITTVHVTENNCLFIGLRNGSIHRSKDCGNTFTLTHEWHTGGYCHTSWSIVSNDNWILIGEYGAKNNTRHVCASDDCGDHWRIVYETPEKKGVHIHRVAIDPYTHDWWITVGDYPIAGRVLYSGDNGTHWKEVKCPNTRCQWEPWQPCNILFFENSIIIINEPLPQIVKVDRKTMIAEYIATIGNLADHAPPYSVVVGIYGIYVSIIRYPKDTHDAGIFVSYDMGYTWQRLVNFTDWAKKAYQSIEPSNVFGANPLIFADGFIHGRWTFGWKESDVDRQLSGGMTFKFRDAYYVPEIQKFNIVYNNNNYQVDIHSNSIVTHFTFNQNLYQINFNVDGGSETLGYCNVTIPKTLLKSSSWKIIIDNKPIKDFTITRSGIYSYLYFTYSLGFRHHIVIKITWFYLVLLFPLILILIMVISFLKNFSYLKHKASL